MKKRVGIGLALAVLVAAGALYASNMAFKLNYQILGSGASKNSTNTLALPFNQQTNIVNANDLLLDIGGTAVVARVTRFIPTTNGVTDYTGVSGTPFALVPAEAYFVQLKAGVATRSYIVVGSHDPTRVVTFNGQGASSKSGISFYAWPYHSTSNDASELLNELGGTTVVGRVSRFLPSNNSVSDYTGVSGTAYALVPGQGYFVQLKTGVPSVQFIPSHF